MVIIAQSKFHPSVKWRVRLSASEVDAGCAVRRFPRNQCLVAPSECKCGFPILRTRWETADGEEIDAAAEESFDDSRKLALRYCI